MRQRGRKSAASLSVIAVDPLHKRLDPPATLSDAERTAFFAIVNACEPKHFRPSDSPLLCRYVEAAVLAEQAAAHLRDEGPVVDGKLSAWVTVQEKAVRALVSLSLRLRLSPSSRIEPKTVGRWESYHQGPHPWD